MKRSLKVAEILIQLISDEKGKVDANFSEFYKRMISLKEYSAK